MISSVLAFSGPPSARTGLVLLAGLTFALSVVLLALVYETDHLGRRWLVRAMVFVAFWVCTTVVYELR